MYNVNLPKQRSFFEIFIERIKYLSKLALDRYPNPELNRDPIVIYILINDMHASDVYAYFEANKYFDYLTIRFIEVKAEINVFDSKGQIVLKNANELLKTSFGNGRFIK